MLNVFLVEDELLMRSMIRSTLDFESYGYHICGECSDGQAAVRLIEEIKPDIVITDIKMEHMDGDQLVEYLYQEHPEIKAIVLSNYGDYKYVRNTMKNHAVDYLIKNDLTGEILLDSLKKAGKLLLTQPDIIRTSINIEELTRKFIINLITGFYKNNKSLIEREMKMLDIHFNLRQTTAVVMVIKDYYHIAEAQPFKVQKNLEFSICNIVNEILRQENQGMACQLENEKFVLLLVLPDLTEAGCGVIIKQILERISFCLKKYMNLSVRYSVGPVCNILNIDESYLMAEQQEKRAYSFRKNEIFFYENRYETEEKKKIGLDKEERDKLTHAIERIDKEDISHILSQLFQKLIKGRYSQVECIPVFDDLLAILMITCRVKQIPQDQLYAGDTLLREYIISQEAFENCRYFFETTYNNLVDRILEAERDRNIPSNVQCALAIMKQRFRNQISLTEVADELELHPSYMSTIFKNALGFGFIEYLTSLRLNEAEKLMSSGNYKLKDVADLSGFPSSHAFFVAYRKKHGVDPKTQS